MSILGLYDIESPHCACHVDKHRVLGHVHTGAHTTSGSVTEVISLFAVGNIDGLCCRVRVVEVSAGVEVESIISPALRVKVYLPVREQASQLDSNRNCRNEKDHTTSLE